MKKVIVLISGLILLTLPNHVFSAANPNQGRVITRDIRETQIREKAELREKVQTGGNGSLQALQKVGENHALRLQNRFSFYEERMSELHQRLQTRFSAMEKKYDAAQLAKARELMAQARQYLDKAKTQSQTGISQFASLQGSDFASVKAAAMAAKNSIETSMKSYQEANRLMKQTVIALRSVERSRTVSPSLRPLNQGAESRNQNKLPVEQPVAN